MARRDYTKLGNNPLGASLGSIPMRVLKFDIMKITNQKKEIIARFEKMGIDFNQDFHKYSFRFGTELTEAAKECGYRQPKNANGSLARYFFYHLQKIKNK